MREQVVRDEFRGLKSKFATMVATISMVFFVIAANRIMIYEAYTSEHFNGYVDKNKLVGILTTNFILLIVFGAFSLAGTIFAIYFTGKFDVIGRVKLNFIDRIFPEIRILGIFIMGIGVVVSEEIFNVYISSGKSLDHILKTIVKQGFSVKELTEQSDMLLGRQYSTFKPEWVQGFGSLALMTICVLTALILLTSLVKNIKNRDFFERSIIGKIIMGLYNLFISKDVSKKRLCLFIAFVFAPAYLFKNWIYVAMTIIIIFILRFYNDYAKIREGIRAIKEGDFDKKVVVKHRGEFERLASDINEIAKAEEIALENELRSQRLRNELISNVSHDLKTPLTSIVTYVDLLKIQGLDTPDAASYLDIIDQKTKRLQKLSGDLFEATKASSGAMPINIEVIDLNGVAQQAVGELNDIFVAADIEVHFENTDEHVYVNADGKMLWRVIENLLTNASKYSMPGTRAYVKVREMGKFAALEISNVSRDALDIEPDELMERFKRGDKSRNTEGSGLGLAIARDLMHMMNGDIRLGIDGDLFKARVLIPRVGQR
mgnify:FL=1